MSLQRDVQSPNREIQRVRTITHTHTNDSPTRIAVAIEYHPVIRSISSIFHKTFTFSHPPNFVLLCLNIYLSLLFLRSNLLSGLPFRNQSSRLMLWC